MIEEEQYLEDVIEERIEDKKRVNTKEEGVEEDIMDDYEF